MELEKILREWEENRHLLLSSVYASTPTTPRLREALEKVPRNLFVPSPYAFIDRAIPIESGQTTSQPSVIARMIYLLNVHENHRVLEVGTGSGYQTALLCELAREVYSIDIHENLVREAAEKLKLLGYENCHLKVGNGCYGWEEYAPYDRIIVSARAEEIPPALLEQLKDGGIMVIPLGGPELQFLTRVVKKDGEIYMERDIPVLFVPLTC